MRFTNLGQVLRYQARRLGTRPALRFKRFGLYHDISWQRYAAEVEAVAGALIQAGVKPGDRVGLLGENSTDWLIADMGILTAGAVTVSPHAPLTARQVHFQLYDAGAVWVIVSTAEQLRKIQTVRSELPDLRGVVVFDGSASGSDSVAWDAFRRHGRSASQEVRDELERRLHQTSLEDLSTVMYTSGTTGNPKGVMLTHGNLLSNAEACQEMQRHQLEDVVLSWLPYTHIYARTIDHYLTQLAGVTLALAESAEALVDNLAEIQPTHMASVPRFYEKVLSVVTSSDPAETGKRLRRIFGPRIDTISSGGAPLPVPIAEAYHAAGLQLMQGYGLTETSPVISFNTKQHHRIGTVGQPIPGVEVKIADDGEVLTRGPHVMKGYWHNPEATAECIRDGWFHTGDLGKLDADGYLSITGRKKELMVLSNGKKVVPSHIEGLLVTDPCIDQALVVGEARNFLTALLYPHWGNLHKELSATTPTISSDPNQLSRMPEVKAFLEKRCREALKDLSHMEQIKKFVILERPFSVEADEMTVSLKLRRNVILDHYANMVEEMYRE